MRKYRFLFLLLLSLAGSGGFLFRDLWFDEALTVLNFACLEPPSRIYRNYVIPNNQILYTLLLHFWMKLAPEALDFAVWLRMLSLITGGVSLFSLWYFFRRRTGPAALFLTLTALAISPAFGLYSTAVRGYALSALWITLTLAAALRFAEGGSFAAGVCYFAGCLGALGTIPSNLAALAGVGLYVMPVLGRKFYRRPRFYALLLLPFLAGVLFYLPILPQFLGVTRLREGWRDNCLTLAALGGAVCWSFGLLIPAALCGVWKNFPGRLWWRGAIWLLPVPAALLLPTAPFPRVYFAMFPLFALLIAGGVRALLARGRQKGRRWTLPLLGGVLLWGVLGNNTALRTTLSDHLGGAGRDDYFYSHYLRPDFLPSRTAAEIRKNFAPGTVLYHSFSSDPWALLFYLQCSGFGGSGSCFDGPRGRVTGLPDRALIILRRGEDASPVADRFGGRAEKVIDTPMHEVYLLRK